MKSRAQTCRPPPQLLSNLLARSAAGASWPGSVRPSFTRVGAAAGPRTGTRLASGAGSTPPPLQGAPAAADEGAAFCAGPRLLPQRPSRAAAGGGGCSGCAAPAPAAALQQVVLRPLPCSVFAWCCLRLLKGCSFSGRVRPLQLAALDQLGGGGAVNEAACWRQPRPLSSPAAPSQRGNWSLGMPC